ncbi:MAG: class I SAM-dependent methyltransferase [Candidatus Omnitrophota bacterium]|nr:class I SAM-dependent methyltransferase [Candidatus Omnitrophota bacterium]
MRELTKNEKLKNAVDLFLISFLALYFEILFIRWIPSSIQITAFFTNIVLIASFLGLGTGCLLSKIKFKLINIFPSLVLGCILLVFALKKVNISTELLQGEILRGFYAAKGINFFFIIAALFCFISLLFVPLGQQLGINLKSFPPLTAYSLNILGGIAGVAVFSYVSFLEIKPFCWFIIGLCAALWFVMRPVKTLLLNIGICFLIIYAVSLVDPASYWSPYQKIDIEPILYSRSDKPRDFCISINNTQLQFALDLSEGHVIKAPYLKHYKAIYEFPYTLFKPENILVLGAGSGNDVSAAIRNGAEEIDAVEIDPFIARLGRGLHPEKPYLSPNVNVFVDDARSFIRRTDKTYDLITFGYLDAHRVLSQFSSVRMDNFIYTLESFSDIKKRLKPGGHVVLTYLGFRRWIEEKLFFGLKEVFGEDTAAVRTTTYNPNDTIILIAGTGARRLALPESPYFKFDRTFTGTGSFISDDWPYLYLKHRGIPLHYLVILLFVLFFSHWMINKAAKLTRKQFNAHFFFLGAGFLLLETASITRFALLFGGTWLVNSAVFVSIMIMILFANTVVAKRRDININVVYALLLGSIFINWLIKPGAYLSFNHTLSAVFSSVIMSLPLFFSGIIFASSFKKAGDIAVVFSCNLLGAVAGGLCEYISMWSGFNFLYLVAMGIYLLSFLNKSDPGASR